MKKCITSRNALLFNTFGLHELFLHTRLDGGGGGGARVQLGCVGVLEQVIGFAGVCGRMMHVTESGEREWGQGFTESMWMGEWK